MMIRHNHRHSRDLNLHSETFALFLHFYFTMAPQISAADSEVRAARARRRLDEPIYRPTWREDENGR